VNRHAPGKTLVGVRVRPGVASALLGPPALELVDVQVELDQLWGRSGAVLGEQLDEAASTEDAAPLLEHELVTRAALAPKPDPLLTEAIKRLQPWRAANVKAVTSELFISARQLRRRLSPHSAAARSSSSVSSGSRDSSRSATLTAPGRYRSPSLRE
jgi:hypothetical protein